jgi:cell migration-inducing and hyaluronan-binding protein
LQEMDLGSFVIFELPEFTTAADGAEQSSLAALRDASETSYFRDDEALWVKLVVADADAAAVGTGGPGGPGAGGPAGGTRIDVSR